LSFFDDGDETVRRPSRGASAAPPAQSRPRQPRPGGRSLQLDRHTLLVRRRVAAGVAVVLILLIVLGINACLKSKKSDELKSYNRAVGEIAETYDSSVARPLFSALTGAAGKSAINVEVNIDQLRQQAQALAVKARGLSTPGAMAGAQRHLAVAFDLRAEALVKIAALVPAALGGQDKQATTKIAGDMELLLASDVLYAERVAPLISQTLKSNGIEGEGTAASRSLPNLGWLEPTTAQARISGQAANSTQSGSFTPGNHGSALKGVSVGAKTLELEPTLNHLAGGGSPTFTLDVENSGEFPETNVKVDVTVTAGGKVFKASHLLEKTEPGKASSVDIPVAGIPLGVAAKIQANIEGVQGENDLENNKGTYLAIFGK
jgi:hypothetical protein